MPFSLFKHMIIVPPYFKLPYRTDPTNPFSFMLTNLHHIVIISTTIRHVSGTLNHSYRQNHNE